MENEEEVGFSSWDTASWVGSTKAKVMPSAKILFPRKGFFPCLNLVKPGHLESQHFFLYHFQLHRGAWGPDPHHGNFLGHCSVIPHSSRKYVGSSALEKYSQAFLKGENKEFPSSEPLWE